MGQAIRDKQMAKSGVTLNEGQKQATTSINRPSSSQDDIDEDALYNEGADRRRHNYIRGLMKEKHEAEQEAEQAAVRPSKYNIKIRSGGGLRTTGKKSIRRKLSELYRSAPSTYKNISMSDRKYFAGVVGSHSKKVRAGVGYGKQVRKKMKRQFNRDRKAGVISKPDYKDMKRMVDNLPHNY